MSSLELAYSPHPDAPLFEKEDFAVLLQQAVTEISSGSLSTGNENVRQVLRQAGLVNLWFLLKFIAGFAGPFDKLNCGLHVDMCNFRQRMMKPGTKAAMFTGRRQYKTTIATEGGIIFGLRRNPDLCIELFSCIDSRSHDFFITVKKFFDANELVAWLYPECVPAKNAERWNDSEIVLPNRSKHFTEPSLRGHGVGCSTQGIHGDWCIVDDPIGDSQLNAERESNLDMEKIKNWLITNIDNDTLIKDSHTFQMFYTATRYAVEDAHTFIFEDIKKKFGYWKNLDDYEEKPDGEWNVYNRAAIEDGVVTFPEAFSKKKLEKMMVEAPWTYFTQYDNNPINAGLNELSSYTLKKCRLNFDEREGWYITLPAEAGKEEKILLSYCDVIIACDPGATAGRHTSRTSSSAVGVVVRDSFNRKFVLRVNRGFVPASTVFDWAYGFAKAFYDYYRVCVLEAQGAFKLLAGVWRDYLYMKWKEAQEAGEKVYGFKFIPQSKVGEKRAVIRNTLEPDLKVGLLYAEESIWQEVYKAIQRFPSGTLDVLDMVVLALKATIRPLSSRELESEEQIEKLWTERQPNRAGY